MTIAQRYKNLRRRGADPVAALALTVSTVRDVPEPSWWDVPHHGARW